MKKIYTFLMTLLACTLGMSAQIFTTSPTILQESSKNVVLYFHADQGNGGLKGTTASTPMYCHIGVITNKSTGVSDWKYVVADWGTEVDKLKFKYESVNLWSLNVGDLRTFFGITDGSEHIEQIAIIPWTSKGANSGRTSAGGDIYIEVNPEGYAMLFTSDATQAAVTKATTINFNVATTENSTITLTVNGQQFATTSGAMELKGSYTLTSPASYEFVATATNGKETLTRTINMAYVKSSEQKNYPGGVPKMGTVKNSDGSVTFCLAAPSKSSVVIVPSWDDYKVLDSNTMYYMDYRGYRYFWITVNGLKDNVYYPYYYLVDGMYKVGDPYARLVLDYTSDKWDTDEFNATWADRPKYPYEKFDDTMLAVYRGDLEGNYKFSDFQIPSHDNLIIYELLLRDFTGDEGQKNGNGNLKKAKEKLKYLRDLGVNAIELMPVMEYGGNKSWGYNTNFYFALDKFYGSPNDLKDFVETAHRYGMAVILDIVLNHSDGLHPWYQMYDISNNPFYNKDAPHAYSVFNDWKQENTLVRQQWKDAITFWMTTYNVDGFRFDLVKGLGTSYSNGNTEGYNSSRVTVMKDLHSAITAVKPDGIHINEHLAGAQEENEMAADGQLNWVNNPSFASVNYVAGSTSFNSGVGYNLANFLAKSYGRTALSTVSFAESHDEQRMAYQALNKGATGINGKHDIVMKRLGQVAVQMLLTPGSKMIWQFGELGDDQNTKNSQGNDTDAKVVNWNYLNDPDRKALMETYQALCHFRKDNPTIFDNENNFTFTNSNGSAIPSTATMRTIRLLKGDLEVVALVNPNVTTAKTIGTTVSKINRNNYQVIAASKDFNPAITTANPTNITLSVPANGYVVFATTNAAGVDDVITDGASKVQVFGGIGEILVNGEYDNIAVYDIAGRVHNTTGLTAGLYIVKVDGETFKVKVQ